MEYHITTARYWRMHWYSDDDHAHAQDDDDDDNVADDFVDNNKRQAFSVCDL